ncbi:virulence RhuM family protein [Chryseobacterium mucoviscidosis]|uniref:Cell filamentation protein Fic n=1 Tax=Chryseobacterium mucoviscidosis TaxID=1945581 RepID=A0A202BZV3_9FLAO|nr:virulence RhuM family protein [Chryseobacterium mucoviscidosis]OVE56986.1 cell filamentation protein Fic [Chryseobacterium mucoviscidosis]
MKESEIILYTTPQGNVKIEIRFEEETFWLTQKKLAELFDVEVNTINYHLKEVFKSGELNENSTIRKIRIVQTEGAREVSREVDFYNLDAIIAVGYRVNSYNATQFRIWATNTLKEFIVKGFVMDDERLKQGQNFGKDYFDELLERIRSIRASERRFYQKITDLYAEASIDYDANAPMTQTFYKTVQNKLHWAITGHTAAELISTRANAALPNMGLQTWKAAPKGKIIKTDVSVAKNYLNEEELKSLERIVSMYLDYAENQASRQIPMKMEDWISKLDAFLGFNEYHILTDAGKISAAVAKKLAETEYAKYVPIQDRTYISDFDNEIKKQIKKQ